jgi:hypothetical protein
MAIKLTIYSTGFGSKASDDKILIREQVFLSLNNNLYLHQYHRSRNYRSRRPRYDALREQNQIREVDEDLSGEEKSSSSESDSPDSDRSESLEAVDVPKLSSKDP